MRIISNKLITPDGTVLHSQYRHDYVTHLDANGEIYFLDGGNEYVRTSVNTVPGKIVTVHDTDSHETVREEFAWGSYGKDGKSPLHRILLKNIEDDHIVAILETQRLSSHIKQILINEQIYRLNKP